MYMLLFYILSFFNQANNLPADVKSKLENEFSMYSRVEFEVKRAPANWKKVKIIDDEDVKVIGSTAYVPVWEVDKRGEKKHTTISVKVKLYNKVFVAVKNIKKREILNPSDFDFAEKEVTSIRGTLVTSIGEVINARAKRNIRKGDILTEETIEKIPVIKPGDKVKATSAVGNVAISFDAIAKQEGSVGDVIRIRNLDNKIFKAKVLDNNNVLIIE